MTVDIQGDCWDWQWAVNQYTGYGVIIDEETKKAVSAHRYFYGKLVGAIPGGMFVLHTCDHRICVNPRHLYIGTAKDNSQDAVKRERFNPNNPPGELAKHALLTQSQVDAIRKRYSEGESTQKQLGEEYEITESAINKIVNSGNWGANPFREVYKRRGNTKLTQKQVDEIRERYARGGTTHRQLAEEYGVVHSQIANILRCKHWCVVEDAAAWNHRIKERPKWIRR